MVVGSCNGMFRAIDVKSGQVRWETKVSPDAAQYFFHGNPLITSSVIVVGADRPTGASIHGFDRATGKELWRHAAGRGVMGPIAGDSERAFASTVEGRLLGLELRTGRVHWSRDLELAGWEGPTLVGDRLFAATVDGSMHALHAATGRDEWTAKLSAPATTSVLAVADDLYVGTSDGSVHRLRARNGAVVATQRVDDALVPVNVPVRVGDVIVVLLQDKSGDYRALVAVDTALAGVRWRVAAQPQWTTSRVFAWRDVVVVGAPTGEVTALCAATGQPAWSRTVKGRVRVIGGAAETMLIGTPSGDLFAIRAPGGCRAY